MRRGTTIALAAIVLALFGAVIIQFVVLGTGHRARCEGTVTAEGSPMYVLPKPDGGLAPLDGKVVTGCGVRIQSAAGSGFWIGQDNNRVFVVAAASFIPRVGDKVDLTGTLKPVDRDQVAGLSDADRQVLLQEVDYLAANTVTPHS